MYVFNKLLLTQNLKSVRFLTMKKYTDEELVQDALKYSSRADWARAGKEEMAHGNTSPYWVATARGPTFFQNCCAHMPNLRKPFTLDELIQSASRFKHRSDWKKAEPKMYNAAWRRKLLDKCCAHMELKANPYSGDYIIYAYEFSDHSVYVGLTFRTEQRHAQHAIRGPVSAHLKKCAEHSRKTLQENIQNPTDAANAERHWIEKYKSEGWTLLNKSRGGGLGSLLTTKWTKESVIAEARKFSTKQAWIEGSQFTYRLAKREGWFAEASAHMPKRVLGIGAGKKLTAEHRRKISEAKTGTKQSKSHRSARSDSIKSWWISKRQPVVKA
jgi:predicted GIY-YIG superfamily endonuclease